MKKILIMSAIVATLFTGCATDNAYKISKVVYKSGKVLVEDISMSDEKRAKLKKIDKGATAYDKIRNVVRGELDQGKLDATISSQAQH
jgi:hypothetical protein